jgi:hypothetical protein
LRFSPEWLHSSFGHAIAAGHGAALPSVRLQISQVRLLSNGVGFQKGTIEGFFLAALAIGIVRCATESTPMPGRAGGSSRRAEPDRGAMAKLNDHQRRTLEMLAHQDGCAEAVLLADGFSIDQLAGLVVQGFAVMQRRRVDISGRMRTVVWMQITEAGRKAITDS